MRAKKIQNKPIVNEVVSDAVEVKRMKKKILALETELEKHKNAAEMYHKKQIGLQTELDVLNTRTIRSSGVKSAHRRQTWGGGDELSLIPVHVHSTTFKTGKTSEAKCNGDIQDIKSIDENGSDATSTFKIPSKVPMIKRSLLAVPTSFKSPVHRTNGMLIHFTIMAFNINSSSFSCIFFLILFTVTMATSNASPIALDKDKRIKALEAEIAELQDFQYTEFTLKSQERLKT